MDRLVVVVGVSSLVEMGEGILEYLVDGCLAPSSGDPHTSHHDVPAESHTAGLPCAPEGDGEGGRRGVQGDERMKLTFRETGLPKYPNEDTTHTPCHIALLLSNTQALSSGFLHFH